MAIKIEHTLQGHPIFRSLWAIPEQSTFDLSKPLPSDGLDSYPDGTKLINQIVVENDGKVSWHRRVKGTYGPDEEEWALDPYTRLKIDSYQEEQINEQNFFFARTYLAEIVGYDRRIIYQSQ